jgi:hypothetical protein
MEEDNGVPPLSRRVPGEAADLRPGRPLQPAAIPEETLRRVLRAFEASREQDADDYPADPGRASPDLPEQPAGDGLPSPEWPGQADPGAKVAFQDHDGAPQPGQDGSAGPRQPAALPRRVPGAAAPTQPPAATGGPAGASPPTRPIAPARPTGPGSRRRRLAGALLSVVVVLVFAAVAAVVLAREVGSTQNDDISPASLRAAAAARNQAAGWVAAQVSPATLVSCDWVMCHALRSRGFPADRLVLLNRGRGNPLRSSIIVADPELRGILRSRLSLVYAPTVIASFGVGRDQVEVRVIASQGAQAYRAALAADQAARRASGRALLHSKRIILSGAARRQLAAGQVDPRLLIIIVGLAAHKRIWISAFGDSGPGASPEVPLRSATFAETRKVVGKHRDAYQRALLGFLRAQRRYKATLIRPMRIGGQHVIRVFFDAPSPLGLLGSGRT